MAAEIRSMDGRTEAGIRKPELFGKIDSNEVIGAAAVLPNEQGVITIQDDKSLRVWLRRDTGQYWPSICHFLSATGSCLQYDVDHKKLFVGLENGTIVEFNVAEDYNSLTPEREYLAHQGKVTAVASAPSCDWVLSCSRDKYFQWHGTQSGRRIGGYQANSACLCLEFDEPSRYAFVGDYSGNIHVLKLQEQKCEVITTLKGHSGSVRSLSWDAERKLLFSGSYDKSIIVWDIGGQKGTAFELHGHKERVEALVYCPGTKQLISSGEDSLMIFWNMDTLRKETPEWVEADACKQCNKPFFWNFKAMWEKKTIGIRQHHCRKCGQAFCDTCTSERAAVPILGYEYPVRMCGDCLGALTDDEKAPQATVHDAKHSVHRMSLAHNKKQLVTLGKDRVIKIWDVKSVLH